MSRHHSTRIAAIIAAAVLSAALGASPALAQAWTPAQGEGAVSLAFQDAFVKYHLFTTTQLDRGHVRSEAMLVDFSYGITDKLALSVSLPFIGAKYDGAYPHLATGIDATGRYHSTFQDFRFDIRYNLARKGLVITPFAGTIMPSHDYTYWAHSAVGRDLREFQVGAYWAKLLDPVLPGLFVTGRYSYGFAQQVLDISHNRSNLDLELGYFVKPELRVFALGAGQVTHGGIDFPDPALWPTLPVALVQHHDQIGRDNELNLGGGAAYSVTPTLDLFGSVVHTVTGRNMHELEYGLTVGMSWSFMTGHAVAHAHRSTAADRATGETRKLLRCVCQKGR
jgi:hypothetical protein